MVADLIRSASNLSIGKVCCKLSYCLRWSWFWPYPLALLWPELYYWSGQKSRILDKSQYGFRKHRSTTGHLVSLERYLRDVFAQRLQAVGLFFDLEKVYETTWQCGIIRDLYRIGRRGRLLIFVSKYPRDRRIRIRVGTTLSDEFYPAEGVPSGGVLVVTCFGLKINDPPSCIARDIFRAHIVDDPAICFRGRSLDTYHRETFTAGSKCHTGMGDKEWFQVCGSQGPRISNSRSTSVCLKHSARGLSTSSQWLLIWSGEETEAHFWCCTGPFSLQVGLRLHFVWLSIKHRSTTTGQHP